MPPWYHHVWYELNRLPAIATMLFGWSLRLQGGHRIPDRGPALILANHQSFFDPLVVGLATMRHLCYLARKTLFKPWIGSYLRSLGAVPVDQEGMAKAGLQTVIEQLRGGRAVLVFPEGERTWDGRMQALKPGIHLILKKVAVPVIPVGIAGAYEAYPRQKPLPSPAPLFMPATGGTIAVSVGRPLAAERLLAMPRGDMLSRLFDAIHDEQKRAEKIRRKW